MNAIAYLTAAPGNTSVAIDELEVFVDSNITSNQTVLVKGKVYVPGGKYRSQRVEEFTATALTAVNPSLRANYTYDSSPQVLTTWRRNTLIHFFDVSLAPSIEDVPAGYQVSLRPAAGSEGKINFNIQSASTGAMQVRSNKQVRLKYTFPRSSRGEDVGLLVDFYYQGKVIKTDHINLRPH